MKFLLLLLISLFSLNSAYCENNVFKNVALSVEKSFQKASSATQRGVANAYNNTEKGVNKASRKTKQGIQRGLKATSNVATSLSSKICNGSDRTIKKIDSVFE